ncbi:MAG TPA: hypothetical protein VE422_28580 [Terriglobia bacterium]|nr:hypothetical protein [Terriglobia bacterium]
MEPTTALSTEFSVSHIALCAWIEKSLHVLTGNRNHYLSPLMVNGESDNWQKVFFDISAVIKKKWNEQNSFDEEGDVAPETVALRDAFNAFPYKTDLFIMDSNDVPTPFGEGRWWTVVKIDFTQHNSSEIIFHGKFAIQELRSGVAIPEAFHLSGSDFDDLAIRGWQEHEFQ